VPVDRPAIEPVGLDQFLSTAARCRRRKRHARASRDRIVAKTPSRSGLPTPVKRCAMGKPTASLQPVRGLYVHYATQSYYESEWCLFAFLFKRPGIRLGMGSDAVAGEEPGAARDGWNRSPLQAEVPLAFSSAR
jgi:hypothetical protein